MVRPLILDLFCGAGGCSVGYHRAGFDVVGVDHVSQKRYPYDFIKADALMLLNNLINERDCWDHNGTFGYCLDDFSAIHASPPCQAYSRCKRIGNARPGHKELVPETRKLLHKAGKPFVIENVEGSPMHFPLMLCGTMFGLRTRRHRLFEMSSLVLAPAACTHRPGDIIVFGHSVELIGSKAKSYLDASGRKHYRRERLSKERGSEAMGIGWMNRGELSQAIPPAYTEYIGKQLIRSLEA